MFTDRETPIALILISTISYLLFADTFRAAISGYSTEDRVVLLGIATVVLFVLLKFEGGGSK